MLILLKCGVHYALFSTVGRAMENPPPPHEMPPNQSCFYVPPLDIDVVPLNRALNPEWLRWEPSVWMLINAFMFRWENLPKKGFWCSFPEQIKPVEYEERSIRCLCNSNSSCSVEKRGTHTIALPLPLCALHLRGNGSVPKLKHKDSLKKVRKRLG